MEQRGFSDVSSEISDVSEHPSTTTISTVAVQAGKAKIVLAILRSNEWIRVRIQQMEPDLMEVGATLEEAKALRREHDELLLKLNAKQKDVTELLTRADDLAMQNKSYQEVYAAMAESLGEAWKDLNDQLEYRKMLLDQSIAFHESAHTFADKMEVAQDKFSNQGTAQDVETARRLLQQHQDIKKSILEASMSTLQEGQSLLDRIREMGMHADVQNRHATTAACYGIEHLLELLQDRRRHLEELWLQRRIKLEQCLQLLLLDSEANKVSDWYASVGDTYLSKTDLGDSLVAAQVLQDEHVRFEMQAREIQDTVLRLIRTADQLVHSAAYDAEGVKQRLKNIDDKCENFMIRLDTRRKNLAMSISFFSLAETALTKLAEIEVQLNSTDLPRNSAALAERHAYLSNAITQLTANALREGKILLERVSKEDPGAKGVYKKVTELQERSTNLENMCKAHIEAGEKSVAFTQFQEKHNQLSTWLTQIGQASLAQHHDMGADLFTARDFLEVHQRLDEDLKKKADLEALSSAAEALGQSGDQEASDAADKAKTLCQQWNIIHEMVTNRIKLANSYVTFHKKAQSLAIQMDALEQYVKKEKSTDCDSA